MFKGDVLLLLLLLLLLLCAFVNLSQQKVGELKLKARNKLK